MCYRALPMRFLTSSTFAALTLTFTRFALAEGTPPPDAAALVEAPKTGADAPKVEKPAHETTATVSAGGQLASGNSKLIALTLKSEFDMRRDANGFGAALLGNYGRSAPPGRPMETTAQNLQGRLRYDRFLVENMSLFLIGTGRHDRFQGLDFRLNVDPGAKYLFVRTDPTQFWGELGYDFQYDIRRDDALNPVDAMGNALPPLDKTATDHSARFFIGFKHAFNKEVTFGTGVEYLQSFVDGTRARVNYDALFAANVGGGLALGLGFSARYDHAPLPGKKTLDTATTVSLIYSFSDAPEAPPAPPPAEPAPAAAPPPPAAPPPAPPAAPVTPPPAEVPPAVPAPVTPAPEAPPPTDTPPPTG